MIRSDYKRGVITPPGGSLWQLDDQASGSSAGSASCVLNGTFNHRANVAIVIIVYSTQNLPSSIQHTSEMSVSPLASYNAVDSISPPNQPTVAIYGGTAAAANAAGNCNASFSSIQVPARKRPPRHCPGASPLSVALRACSFMFEVFRDSFEELHVTEAIAEYAILQE